MKLPDAVTSICWHSAGLTLLATTIDGTVVQLPIPSSFPSTEHSFDLNLPYTSYKVVLKPPAPKKKPLAVVVEPSEADEKSASAADSESKLADAGELIDSAPKPTGSALAAIYNPKYVRFSSNSLSRRSVCGDVRA